LPDPLANFETDIATQGVFAMKQIFRLILPLFLTLVGSKAFALDQSAVPGNYELQSVMETAGMLVLSADQKYSASFSYGAADWVEEGTWKIEGNEIVLSGGKFKVKNHDKIPLFLPSGTRFKYQDAKLTMVPAQRKVVFLDPNKSSSSEGRMRVRGKVMKLDAEYLVVDVEGECLTFNVRGLSEAALKKVKQSQGKAVDVEIPYSAIMSSGGC
jgi:hypothetical protein